MSAFSAHFTSGGSTVPHFDELEGTARPAPASTTPAIDVAERVRQWLASSAARPYDGLWVLLAVETMAVEDSDPSARELAARHPGAVPIVYVLPPRTRLG